MAEAEIVYVAVIPLENPTVGLVKAVAEIIGKDAYQTRLLIVGSIPRIIARCNGVREAEATARRLREAGLTTIVCPDAELRQPFNGVRARTLEFGDRGVTFKTEGGEGVTPGVGSVFLIIKGTRQHVPEAEEEIIEEAVNPKTQRKLNVGATVMLGGLIPIYKKVKPKSGQTEPSRPEWFLRLYERKSSQPVAEVLQYGMEYSFLGAETVASSVANFINVVKKLREVYPRAIYDERLMKGFSTDIPGTSPDEDIDINCRLIYFQYL